MTLLDVLRAFGLVAIAELGDKSQLVCFALAARHRALPVLAGAVAAFVVLNAMAALLGAAVGALLPERAVRLGAAALFAVFGVRALIEASDDGAAPTQEGRSPFVAAFLGILLAELGDKTQLEVVGLAAAFSAFGTFVGATIALASTSALAVAAGRIVGDRLPGRHVQRASGILFLGFAAWLIFDVLRG